MTVFVTSCLVGIALLFLAVRSYYLDQAQFYERLATEWRTTADERKARHDISIDAQQLQAARIIELEQDIKEHEQSVRALDAKVAAYSGKLEQIHTLSDRGL